MWLPPSLFTPSSFKGCNAALNRCWIQRGLRGACLRPPHLELKNRDAVLISRHFAPRTWQHERKKGGRNWLVRARLEVQAETVWIGLRVSLATYLFTMPRRQAAGVGVARPQRVV